MMSIEKPSIHPTLNASHIGVAGGLKMHDNHTNSTSHFHQVAAR